MGRLTAVFMAVAVLSRSTLLFPGGKSTSAHSETHCNELVSSQIHAPAALFPANSSRNHAGPGGLQNANVTVPV